MPIKPLEYISGVVDEVKLVKSGETNGRSWKRYKVFIDGQEFTAWDEEWLGKVGQRGRFAYHRDEKNVNGAIIETYTLLKPFSSQRTVSEAQPKNYQNASDVIVSGINKILDNQQAILRSLKTIESKLDPTLEPLE
jgi:hypothetical protein